MKFDDLFHADGIFLQTENYILRRILPEEKKYYEALAQAECLAFLQPSDNFSALAWE